ncbi:MAG: hypothetical protein GXO88_05430 [Chlorobi bacterium]|nr:hypothetical protein [Chlorobiota bacterium]
MRYLLKGHAFLIVALTILMLGAASCRLHGDDEHYLYNTDDIVSTPNDFTEDDALSPPPFSEDIFPCSDCHEGEPTNHEPRKLVDMHEEISEMFDHDKENRWCLDCHNADDRDYLKSASGKLISFEDSYKLCGQCHGDKLRDWKVGVHGKRTGMWNGKKQYYLCVNCHNPHSPHFKSLKPMPPPERQEDIYYKDKD